VHEQLRFLGLAATRAYKPQRTTIATTHLLHGLDQADLNDFDFDETHHEFRQLLIDIAAARRDAAAGKPVAFNPGRQCRWCPAFMDPNGISCPKQRELTALVKADIPLRIENAIPFNDDVAAADAYALAKQLGILLKRINSALYARANERAIPLPDGKMFGPKEKRGQLQLDGDIAYEVVRELHGQAIADVAVAREATQTSIENALKFVAPHGDLASAKRRVLNVIKERGGTSQKTSTKLVEYDEPQRLLKEAV
jgi:hypothetical protein